ncbi:hypothetical protein JB92DRAFT_3133183 [Gautieria morchelliformis]|nr:hypothetical protein JB92DRAFT_3133183 [Gautieria morchelliformis]
MLFGFVKYFWRDAVARVRKAKRQELLEARVSGVDVAGLGISPLAGHTLVQWAGCLTERDFHAICQVTPFILYDLVPADCMRAWTALSRMVPLIWQPVIEDSRAHLVELGLTIDHCLDCMLKWTPRWFNKTKFHILLHLTEHIRQLGPTILFATEGFMSFNAVMCAKSVHSNRHAPSRDIALAFAQSNRVHHLMSGGAFQQVPAQSSRVDEGGVGPGASHVADMPQLPPLGTVWRQASMHTLAMIPSSKTVMSYLSFREERKGAVGMCSSPYPERLAG